MVWIKMEMLKGIKWNGLSTVTRPERISPWKIDRIEISSMNMTTPVPLLRMRPHDPHTSSASFNQGVGPSEDMIEPAAVPVSEGQETSGILGAPNSEIQEEPSFAQWIIPLSSSDSGQVQRRRLEKQPSRITVHASTTVYPSNVLPSTSNGCIDLTMRLGSCNPQTCTAYGTNMLDGYWSLPHLNMIMNNSISQGSSDPEPSEATNASSLLTGPLNNTSCMLFGVDLLQKDTMSAPGESSTNTHHSSQVPLVRSQSTIPSNSSGLVKHCQNCYISRSCIKVYKFGSALGRIVDLTSLNSYDELMHELDQMFDFKGTLEDQNSDWHVIYKDAEGDILSLGDSAWEISMYGAKVAHLPKGAAGERL